MQTHRPFGWREHSDCGLSLLMVSVGMIFLLGMLGLGIDLASLYVGRTQAQRSADAAALAGARAFVDSTYTSGGVSAATAQAWALERAKAVGNANLVAGVSPNISDSDISFNFTNPEDPQITVVAARDTIHGNAMPTFFIKIFGIQSANVSTSATAEAFNPSGSGMSVGASCVKPWLMPNCDAGHEQSFVDSTHPAQCYDERTGNYGAYFIYPDTGAIVNPGPTSSGGSIGELLTVKPGLPADAATPSKFMPVYIPPGSVPSVCPSCTTGGGSSGGSNSGAIYRQNIECCNQNEIVCGSNEVWIDTINGDKVGPTAQGVDCLINESPSGRGQDTLNTNSTPFTVTAGSNNPFFPPGSTISLGDSSSTVTVPIWNVPPPPNNYLCPGSSCSPTVNVIGFLQMFVKGEYPPQGRVDAYVLNISGCGGGGSSGGGSGSGNTISSGGSPVPIRLIYPTP